MVAFLGVLAGHQLFALDVGTSFVADTGSRLHQSQPYFSDAPRRGHVARASAVNFALAFRGRAGVMIELDEDQQAPDCASRTSRLLRWPSAQWMTPNTEPGRIRTRASSMRDLPGVVSHGEAS
jgi:hypothetical protein